MTTQVQPIYLVSVNNTPEIAKKLVAELIDVRTILEIHLKSVELIICGFEGD
jgi:hypothetical protein